MDYKIVWTLRAREDLKEIAEFIARDNPTAALRVGESILRHVDLLERFPLMGRIVPERGQPHVREIVVGNYRTVYRVREEQKVVEVLRVWHGARGEPVLDDNAGNDENQAS